MANICKVFKVIYDIVGFPQQYIKKLAAREKRATEKPHSLKPDELCEWTGCKVQHLALIPDGNRRWAKQRLLKPWEGHKNGSNRITDLVQTLYDQGVHTITIWVLSPENFGRPVEEIEQIWKLFTQDADEILALAQKYNASVKHLGQISRLPPKVKEILIDVLQGKTQNNVTRILNLGIDYGGRQEIVHAASKIQGPITIEEISKNIWTGGQLYPEPNLIVRTGTKDSKTVRVLGFMSWQSAYSEFLFVDDYFPDVTTNDVKKWINNFSKSERRFGK